MNEAKEDKNKIILVPCVICERFKPEVYMNIKKSYPVTVITNVVTPNGFKHATIQAYLCEVHYIQQKDDNNAN